MESLTQVTTVYIHADKTVYAWKFMDVQKFSKPDTFENGREEKVHYCRG